MFIKYGLSASGLRDKSMRKKTGEKIPKVRRHRKYDKNVFEVRRPRNDNKRTKKAEPVRSTIGKDDMSAKARAQV